MFWLWSISNDIQLFLLTPFLILLYKKSPAAGIAMNVFLTLVATIIGIVEVNDLKIRASGFALENYYLFGDVLSKPYTKFGVFCMGVLYSHFYMNILQYR